MAIPSISRGASVRLPWHRRFRKPPLSSRSVGFPKDRLATMTFPADLPVREQVKVLTNIHPSRPRFASLLGTSVQSTYPGSESVCSLLPGRHWPHVRFDTLGTQ